jgi:hypothetical protein
MPVSGCDGISIAAARAVKWASSKGVSVRFTVAGIELVASPEGDSDDLTSEWFAAYKEQQKQAKEVRA